MGVAGKLLADGERQLVVVRPHVRQVFPPALLLLVLAPVAAFGAAVVPPGVARGPVRMVVIVLALLVALRWVLWPFLLWWNTVYVLTDERFFERRGLVRRSGHDLPLQGVTDVVVAQSLGERLLRCGTLRVVTEGGGEIVLTDVPAIARVQRSLLAVTDDITHRLRSPGRRHEEFEEFEEVGELDEHPWDDHDDDDEVDVAPPAAPPRAEARRREREVRRRLGEIGDLVRRTPVPDSPLEDDGDPEDGHRQGSPAQDGEPSEDNAHDDPHDDGGARILRFPPRS